MTVALSKSGGTRSVIFRHRRRHSQSVAACGIPGVGGAAAIRCAEYHATPSAFDPSTERLCTDADDQV
jgi:hypothetical protein